MIFETIKPFFASGYQVKYATEAWERRGAAALRRAVFCREQGLFPEDDADENERVAGRRLQLAKELQDDGKAEKARDVLQEIVKKYPKTKAAEEAQKLLKDEK